MHGRFVFGDHGGRAFVCCENAENDGRQDHEREGHQKYLGTKRKLCYFFHRIIPPGIINILVIVTLK